MPSAPASHPAAPALRAASREGSQASRPSAKPAGSSRDSALLWLPGCKCLVVDFHRARGPRSRDSSIGVMKIILIQMVMVCVEKFNGSLAGTSRKTALAREVKPQPPWDYRG